MNTINISLCPSAMERDGDALDEAAVEAMIRDMCDRHYPGSSVSYQVGYNQGDEWYQLDGRDSPELYDLISELEWEKESLYC